MPGGVKHNKNSVYTLARGLEIKNRIRINFLLIG